jgi:DNA-binding NarL/FixJ family response regulator
MQTSIFFIDDDVEFGKGLMSFLRQHPFLKVVGPALTCAEARAHIESNSEDIYLVDITLPDGSGVDVMRLIRRKHPEAKILALSTLGDEKHVVSSIEAGAVGYLLKSEIPENILRGIISLINNGGFLSGHSSKVLIDKMYGAQHRVTDIGVDDKGSKKSMSFADGKAPALTPKEYEILTNAQRGKPAKVIADVLQISIFTVNQHLRSIYRKLNVRNKMEAVQAALRHGIL